MAENVEAKFECDDLAAAERAAVGLGATFAAELRQIDTYFRVPRGRLKVREQVAPLANAELIRYDRTDDSAVRVSRYDRLPVADPRALVAILTAALGEPYAIVRKRRRLYRFETARIHLDAVDELGTFVEIEVVLPGEPEGATAVDQALADRLVRALGGRPDRLRGGSYSDLLETKRRSSYKG